MTSSKKQDNFVRQPAQERSQKRVEQILSAAKRIIAEKGSAGLTISGIAKEAGVTAGSMYQYFENKNAIIYALGERYLIQNRQKIESQFDTMPETREEFRACIVKVFTAFVTMHATDPVVRDIWMGASVNKEANDLDWEDTKSNAVFFSSIAKPLYPEEMHAELDVKVLLLLQFALTAAKPMVEADQEQWPFMIKSGSDILEATFIEMEKRADALEASNSV